MAYNNGYVGGYSGGSLTTFMAPLFSNQWGNETVGHDAAYSLWRRYEPVVEFVQTVIITGGVAAPLASEGARILTPDEITNADAGSGENGKAVFRGKKQHTVTESEGAALLSAGYIVT